LTFCWVINGVTLVVDYITFPGDYITFLLVGVFFFM